MSVPFGAPQQQPPGPAQHQPQHGVPGGHGAPGAPAAPGANSINLNLILPLVAAGLALVAFLIGFADDAGSTPDWLLAAGLLAGISVLPNMPKVLPFAAVLAAVPTLGLIQSLVKVSSVQGLFIVVLIVALLETAAIVFAFLLTEGVVKFEPKPANPYGGAPGHGQPGGWNPQSGAFPQPGQPAPGQFGQPQQQAPQQPQFGQQPQQPAQPGQQPQATSFMPQPGQFGSPGTPPGGFGGPQQ